MIPRLIYGLVIFVVYISAITARTEANCNLDTLHILINEIEPKLDNFAQKRLISAIDINDSKCNFGSFFQLQILTQVHKPEHFNLVAFLQDCSLKQFEVCKGILAKKFEEAEDRLDKEGKQKLVKLIQHLRTPKQDPTVSIIKGFLSIVELDQSKSKDLSNREVFEEVFFESVYEKFCKSYSKGMVALIQVFKSVIDGQDMTVEMDAATQSRIAAVRVCWEVVMNMDHLIKKTHDLYLYGDRHQDQWMIKENKYNHD